jgi:hypothetical protein
MGYTIGDLREAPPRCRDSHQHDGFRGTRHRRVTTVAVPLPLPSRGVARMKRYFPPLFVALTLAFASPTLIAEEEQSAAGQPQQGYGWGPGVMQGPGYGYGYGPGMTRGPSYGPGYQMGPGMMRGPGYGPGYQMGPGMMYGPGYGYGPGGPGYQMGPGMMYGPGYGPGYPMGPGMMQGPGSGWGPGGGNDAGPNFRCPGAMGDPRCGGRR